MNVGRATYQPTVDHHHQSNTYWLKFKIFNTTHIESLVYVKTKFNRKCVCECECVMNKLSAEVAASVHFTFGFDGLFHVECNGQCIYIRLHEYVLAYSLTCTSYLHLCTFTYTFLVRKTLPSASHCLSLIGDRFQHDSSTASAPITESRTSNQKTLFRVHPSIQPFIHFILVEQFGQCFLLEHFFVGSKLSTCFCCCFWLLFDRFYPSYMLLVYLFILLQFLLFLIPFSSLCHFYTFIIYILLSFFTVFIVFNIYYIPLSSCLYPYTISSCQMGSLVLI